MEIIIGVLSLLVWVGAIYLLEEIFWYHFTPGHLLMISIHTLIYLIIVWGIPYHYLGHLSVSFVVSIAFIVSLVTVAGFSPPEDEYFTLKTLGLAVILTIVGAYVLGSNSIIRSIVLI